MTPKLLSTHAGRQPARLIFALLAAAVLLLAQQPTPANAYPLWTSSMVAGLGEEEVDGPLDLKFDATGNPYLAIGNVDPPTDLTRWGLLLAEWDGSAWRTSRAYARAWCIGDENTDLSLAVSADGRRAAISFWESCDAHFAVLFGVKSSEGTWNWQLTELPYTYDPDIRGGDFYLPSAVAFDSNGWAHLIFGMDLQVYYSYYSPFNTSWSERQPVTDSNHINRFYWLDVSLAVDADNKLHAAFDYGDSEGHSALTTYAYQNTWLGGDWSNEDVAATGGHHSLALDSLGRPRIAFHDSNAHSLKFAWRSADGWNITTVDAPDPGDTVGDAGLYPSLTIDAANNIHISYIYDYAPDSAWGTVRYAAYAVHGDDWQKESVDFISNYKWTALGLDNTGAPHITYIANEDVFYATRSDTTGAPPPNTFIDSGPARVDNESPVTFTFHSDDPAATFECLGPSTSFVACTSPHTWAIGGGGNYTFWVRAVSAGQADPSPAFYTFTRDMTPPDSQILSTPPTDSPDPTFTFTANEPSTFQCRVVLWKNRPPGYVWPAFQTCTSPKTFTGVDDGSWVFELMATDAYGNAETYANAALYYWTLDQIGPPTTITSGKPAAVTTITTATFTFSSSDASYTFECQLDGGGFAACASPQSYSNLGDGSHTFEVRAIDGAAFADPTPAGHTWTIDTVVPDTTLTGKPYNPSRSNSATFTFSSGEAGATFECQLDSGDFAACASPQSYSNLADGSHTFSVQAKDAAGNVDPSPAAYTWTIDTVVPDTTIDAYPPNPSTSSSATFAFSSTEAGATFACKLDSADYGPCTSPKSYSGLSDGSHTFTVRAGDAAGNLDPTPASYTWTLDATPPNTTITTKPAALSNDPTPDFAFTSSEGNYAAGIYFYCQTDANAWVSCGGDSITYFNLFDGDHTFRVKAEDTLGNVDPTPATWSWTIDLTAPETTITAKPAAATSSTNATFEFTSSEAGTFECKLDSGSYAACTSPKSYTGLSEASHTFQARATDAAGNVGSPAAYTWIIDTTPPDTTITAHPDALTNSATAAFSFTGVGAASFECKLDSGGFVACTSPISYTGLYNGSHTFHVRATDAAGNYDTSSASYTWTVDTNPPDTTITQWPTSPSVGNTAVFTFSSETGATFECSLDGATFAACFSPINYTGLSDGSHTFQVRARDAAGNADASPASYTWTIDATPPETTITGTPNATTNSTSATFTFSGVDADSFECKLESGVYAACTSPQSYSGLAAGSHTFFVRAKDTEGRYDQSPAMYTWTIDTTPPETTLTGQPPATTNSTSATFTFTGDGAASFECKLDSGSFATCVSPKSYSSLANGSHTFQVRAIDAAGNIDPSPASYTWTIDTTPPETTLNTYPPDPSTNATATFTFSSEAGATFQCKLDAGAFTACASPQSYTGLSDGLHAFAVLATDAAGNVDPSPATYTWTQDANPPETNITGQPAATTNRTTAEFTFTGVDATSFECKLDAAEFAACASPQSYTGLAAGSHTFAVRAKSAGQVDPTPAVYTWAIDLTAPVTTIDTYPANPSNSSSATFTFSSEPGVTFQCKLDFGEFTPCTSPQSYTGLSDGFHGFAVLATDAAGNTEATPPGYAWVIDTTPPDTTPPETTIDTPIGDVYTVDTITIEFSSEAGATFQCALDGAAWSDCLSPITYNALADGPHTFEVRATDATSNTDPSPATATWTVQTPGPDTSLDSYPPNPSNSPTAGFTFSSAETDQFECSLDDAPFVACTSPHQVTNLADGPHFFAVRAVNDQGKADTDYPIHFWIVDTTPPSVTSNQADTQADPTTTGPIHFTVLFTEPVNDFANADVTLGGTAGATTAAVTNLHDHMEYDVAVSGMTGNGTVSATVAAGVAHDAAGNGNTASTSTDNTVTYNGFDTTPPDTTLTAAPDTLTNNNDPSFSFSSNEPGSSFTCQLDSQPATPCVTPQSYTDVPDGSHTFTVFATDAAGNADLSPASHTWTIDTTGPDTTINSGPSGITGDNDPSFAFSSEARATFECQMDSDPFATCTSPWPYTNLSDGPHTFRVRATDAAGNTGPTAERAFTVDSAAPSVSIDTHPPALTNNNDPSFTFSGEAGAALACKLDGGAFAPCDSPESYTDLADGEHTFTVWAIDDAGNSAEAAYTWTIDTTPPLTTITAAPPDPSPSADASFSFTSESGAAFECRLDGSLWGACDSPRFYAGLSEGSHTFEVRASDLAGNTGPAAGHTWTIDLPAAGALYVTARGGNVPGAGAYQKNDILKWNGSAWSIWFDGATAGLPPTAQIAAFDVDNAAGSVWVVIRQAMKLPGVGKMQPYQIAYYNGSTWSRFFDGGDVGLKTSGERINGLEVLPGSVSPIGTGCQYYLLISTVAGGGVPIGGTNVNFTGEDVLGFCMTQGGANTAGSWHLLFEGQSEGLQKNNNLGLSASDDATTLYFTVKKNFTGDGGLVKPSELFSFSGGVFSGPLWKARDHGLMQVVDGIDVVGLFQ